MADFGFDSFPDGRVQISLIHLNNNRTTDGNISVKLQSGTDPRSGAGIPYWHKYIFIAFFMS